METLAFLHNFILKLITFETLIPIVKDYMPLKSIIFMKKLLIPAIVVVAVGLLYNQSQDSPNIYINAGAIVVFMFLLFKLNTRIPHKNDPKNDQDVQ